MMNRATAAQIVNSEMLAMKGHPSLNEAMALSALGFANQADIFPLISRIVLDVLNRGYSIDTAAFQSITTASTVADLIAIVETQAEPTDSTGPR